MDGIHDLGGKQGYGPIDVNEPVEPWHAEWEKRVWGISCSGTDIAGGTIDWWRHVRETTIPMDYLSRPYLDSYSETDVVTLVDSGVCTVDELVTGKSNTEPLGVADTANLAEVLEINRASATRYDRTTELTVRYALGDKIVASQFASSGHTRLPAYVRGRPGKIHAHHGAHLLPDAGAKGEEIAEHLYTVAFDARDLWPEAQSRTDVIFVDLWESYLDPR